MPRSSHSKETATASKTETSAASQPSRPTTNETKLVNFRLPTADQFSVAVDSPVDRYPVPRLQVRAEGFGNQLRYAKGVDGINTAKEARPCPRLLNKRGSDRTRRQLGRTNRSLSIAVGDQGGPSIEIIRQARSGLCALRSTVPCRSGFTSVVECASVTR